LVGRRRGKTPAWIPGLLLGLPVPARISEIVIIVIITTGDDENPENQNGQTK
jgi:hypothetical protein